MKKSVKVLLIILCVLMALVFLYSGYRVTSTIHDYKEADRYYNAQIGRFASHEEEQPLVTRRPSVSGEPDPEPGHSPIKIDFDALLETCSDVKGWLYSPDTVIDYPVVQSKDNSYYLHRFMDGTYNPNGTLFVDYRCAGDFSGKNTMIYGHHMQNGTMLASIVDYKKQEYYDEHPVMYLNTPGGNYRMDIFCGFVTWYDSRVYMTEFGSRTEFEEWYTLMRSYSDFQSDVEINPDDRFVTLSTCTYDYDNARYVVMAKLVPLD